MTLVEHEVPVETPAAPVFPELIRAAEIIRERGWCQGGYHADAPWPYSGGPVCAEGALGVALGDRPGPAPESAWPIIVALAGAVGRDPLPCSIAIWNDAPGRTQEEVIELLERVGYGL